mmetsp:Transcript_32537/g.96619  ORF Transcript_32537/g.96619 Transcript_32537/m.96619 type:complete len:298 (+) Transcript_32537:386-1279(+)
MSARSLRGSEFGPSMSACSLLVADVLLHARLIHPLEGDAHILGDLLEAPVQVVQTLDQVHGLGRPLKPQTSAQELVEFDLTAAVGVDEVEEALRLRRVDVDGLEELLDFRALEVDLELIERDDPGFVLVQRLEEAARLAQLLHLPDLLCPVDGALDEGGVHDVHDQEQRKGGVEEEPDAHVRRDVGDHGVRDFAPIQAPCEPLEEAEHRQGDAAVERGELRDVVRLLQARDRAELGEVDGHHVQHQHDEPQRPDEGLGRPHQAAHQHLQLAGEPHDVEHADRPHRPQHADDAQDGSR